LRNDSAPERDAHRAPWRMRNGRAAWHAGSEPGSPWQPAALPLPAGRRPDSRHLAEALADHLIAAVGGRDRYRSWAGQEARHALARWPDLAVLRATQDARPLAVFWGKVADYRGVRPFFRTLADR
jgi:hypothetical protein